MCPSPRTMLFLYALLLLFGPCLSAPSGKPEEKPAGNATDVEAALDRFLDAYYDRVFGKQVDGLRDSGKLAKVQPEDDIYETMQGDQPVASNVGATSAQYVTNSTALKTNLLRAKETFIQFYKKNLLQNLGRGNFSMPKMNDTKINVTDLLFFNTTFTDEITKFRSFYPSCELPANADQELWKDDDIMNLFFNFDYISNDRNANIATATLRLYRLPDNSTQFNSEDRDCDDPESTEEENLLRVSIYWYIKSLKRRRVKRKLADSKVISVFSRYVELNIMPAAKAWTKDRNLGLGVLVQDQEDNLLKADRFFKGASCTVGTSTPKAIPTAFTDTVDSNELKRVDSLLGRNTTAALHGNLHLLPIMSICTQESPQNHTQHLRSSCSHIKGQEDPEKAHLERLMELPQFLNAKVHIRHQRQYLANKKNEGTTRDAELRSKIVGATPLFTREQWQNPTNSNKFNFSTINR